MKSLKEVKEIIKKFKEASGVGYVIYPTLAKIAADLGIQGYKQVLIRWESQRMENEMVITEKESAQVSFSNLITWDGPALYTDKKDNYHMGIKKTIELIDDVIKYENKMREMQKGN